MITIYLYSLAKFRGQILGWGLALFLMGAMAVVRYNLMLENQQLIRQLLEGTAGEFIRMFGDIDRITTPGGFLSLAFFTYLPLVLGVFAILSGGGLLVADEENGTLDLLLAHPISRTSFFLGRVLAFVTAALAILTLSWLGFLIAMPWSKLHLGWWALARPYLSLAAVVYFFGGLALMLSMLLPARRTASMTTGVILLASYFLTTLERLDKGLASIARFSPLDYYQGGEAIDGLNVRWFAGLMIAAGLFAAAAWRLFELRDIRVVGESGWRWPIRRRRNSI
jgi:ABC-2 type transport system permease protein